MRPGRASFWVRIPVDFLPNSPTGYSKPTFLNLWCCECQSSNLDRVLRYWLFWFLRFVQPPRALYSFCPTLLLANRLKCIFGPVCPVTWPFQWLRSSARWLMPLFCFTLPGQATQRCVFLHPLKVQGLYQALTWVSSFVCAHFLRRLPSL